MNLTTLPALTPHYPISNHLDVPGCFLICTCVVCGIYMYVCLCVCVLCEMCVVCCGVCVCVCVWVMVLSSPTPPKPLTLHFYPVFWLSHTTHTYLTHITHTTHTHTHRGRPLEYRVRNYAPNTLLPPLTHNYAPVTTPITPGGMGVVVCIRNHSVENGQSWGEGAVYL